MFPQTLSYLRKRENKTQKELAKELGIAQSTLAGYEQGTREPSFETLEVIANYFGVTKANLLGENEMPPLDLQHFAETKKEPTENGGLKMSMRRRALIAFIENASEEEVNELWKQMGEM